MITIGTLVDRAARRFGGRVAVVDGDRRLSFREVGERSTRLANGLLGLSPTAGSRVALVLGNRLEVVETDFAIAKAGKVKVPINPRLSDEERRFILANCGAEVVVTERGEVDRVQALRSDLPDLHHVVSVDGGGTDYGDLLRASASTPEVAVDPEGPSMILHTSGTTGRPKGATTSQSARIAATRHMLLDEFLATVDDGMVHVAPMSHGSGSKILAYFVRGARNITLPRFTPEEFFVAMTEAGGTSSFVVPTMIRMLLDSPQAAQAGRAGVRNLTYGGAPMPASLAEEAIDAFGPVLTQVYGSCEAPHPVTSLSQRDHVEGPPDRLGSAGHEVFGVEVRIAGEDGEEQPWGEPGELWVRGPNLMSGYWNDPEATAKVTSDGWYRSGDVARRGDHGFVHIVGRERDMLISGGLNVYPAEVEGVLHRHPDVAEAAVFGVPDDLWGERVTAAVVLRDGSAPDADDLVRWCAEHLATYKKPRSVLFVESLPKGSTGKVAKETLRVMAAG